MAREMGRNCCVNWWRPHQRAETFPTLFFFFFFVFTTLTWFVSGKTGRTERRFKFCRLVLLPEWIRRRCHRPAPGKRRRRILWANTKWNCRDESTIWWAKKKMEATWVDCCCWTAFYSFDRRCRSFQMCLECWTESRWWAKMTATASRDLFWHEKRRRQTTKTKKTTRKTRNVHINRKRITSFLRITIFVFSKRFVDGLFFFFLVFLFFVFLKFWNFGWEVYRHHKEYIVEFPSLLDFSITLNVSLKRTDGTTSSGHFDGPFAVESRSTGTFQTLAFNSAGFAFAVDAIHWSEWSHHWMPSRPV